MPSSKHTGRLPAKPDEPLVHGSSTCDLRVLTPKCHLPSSCFLSSSPLGNGRLVHAGLSGAGEAGYGGHVAGARDGAHLVRGRERAGDQEDREAEI